MGTISYGKKGTEIKDFIQFCILAVVALSNLSQLPMLVEAGVTNVLSMPIWVTLLFVVVLVGGLRLTVSRSTLPYYLWCGALVLVLAVMTILTSNSYLSGDMFRSLVIALFVFLIGGLASDFITPDFLSKLSVVYSISTLLVAGIIYVTYLVGYDLDNRLYVYESKNSISAIILSAIVFFVFGFKQKAKWWFWFRIVSVAFLTYVLALLKSRASLIGLGIVIFALLRDKKISKSKRFLVLLLTIVAVVVVLRSKELYEIIIENILFANRNMDDLNDISSNRFVLINRAWSKFEKYPMIGLGNYYVDCFPIAAWVNYGMVLGTILIALAWYPCLWSFGRVKDDGEWRDMTFVFVVLACTFVLNSFFECLTPFGPGIKCYVYWFLFGVLGKKEIVRMKKSRRIKFVLRR